MTTAQPCQEEPNPSSMLEEKLDTLFGGIDAPRTSHIYDDGIVVEILNVAPESQSACYNGTRVFYENVEGSTRKILCRFPGYTIDKYVIATADEESTTKGIDEALEPSLRGTSEADLGALCLTNDGPLLLVFKVAGVVRLHMMRSANHGFDSQFADDFLAQYHARFDDLFSVSIPTSMQCFLFRQGARSSAMTSPLDSEWHSLLFLGTVQCTSDQTDANVEERPVLVPQATSLTVGDCVNILRSSEIGLVCYRHATGEVQMLSEAYLQRVATCTGVTMDELISGVGVSQDNEERPASFHSRPSVFLAAEGLCAARLASSRFPRTLDLFALYVLCGTNSARKTATVNGFSTRIDRGGRVVAFPKRGFYNFCRAAGVNPRKELTFPATPSVMRLAVRRIILRATLPSRKSEVEQQFADYETALNSLVPMLILRVLSGSAALESAFEAAFGIKVIDTISNLPIPTGAPATLRTVRSAVLLCDHYRLMTIARFALKHLLNAEFTPSAMRAEQLVQLLTDYSTSSRRRRAVADSVAATNMLNAQAQFDEYEGDDYAEWPVTTQA